MSIDFETKKKDILMLVQTCNDDYAMLEWRKNGVRGEVIHKDCSKFLRGIRKIHLLSGLPFISIWFGKWKLDVKKYSTIIVHASQVTIPVAKWIKINFPEKRVILWYWNPVNTTCLPTKISDRYCEKWSFDESNCEEYHLKFNPQYYFKTMSLPEDRPENNLFFVGSANNKGKRVKKVEEIYAYCKENGIPVDINLVGDTSNLTYPELSAEYFSYKEILEHIGKTTALLEILQDTQSGPTLRTMEALFFGRKLVTNNTRIKSYLFYNPNNIFILGEDDLKNLKCFLQSDYQKIPEDIVDYYEFNNWLKRFLDNA